MSPQRRGAAEEIALAVGDSEILGAWRVPRCVSMPFGDDLPAELARDGVEGTNQLAGAADPYRSERTNDMSTLMKSGASSMTASRLP